jgi:hypothetical protein
MVVPCHVAAGTLIRKLTDFHVSAEVTVNVPDSLPDAILYATPSPPFPVPVVDESSISLSDAPHELNCGEVSPSYWTQIAMIRSPAAGASVVKLGKVCVRLAGLVVDERRVLAPVVGIVGNATRRALLHDYVVGKGRRTTEAG